MPHRNRVTPMGEIIATSARGLFMGNRGKLLNSWGEMVRTHQGKRWITCVLGFRDRWGPVMTPGVYTELFFQDEALPLPPVIIPVPSAVGRTLIISVPCGGRSMADRTRLGRWMIPPPGAAGGH